MIYKYRNIRKAHPLLVAFEDALQKEGLKKIKPKSGGSLATLGRALRCNVFVKNKNDLHSNP